MLKEDRLYWNIPDNAWDDDPRCPYRYDADDEDDEEEEVDEDEIHERIENSKQ